MAVWDFSTWLQLPPPPLTIMNERGGYGFSSKDKNFVRNRAKGWCEYPADNCPNSNDTRVHHLTGAYVAKLDKKDPESIRNPITNALMLCSDHSQDLDDQEAYEVEALIYEAKNDKNS